MKGLTLMLAVACYGSAVWGAMFYFRTEDRGARWGKRVISVAGGTGMIAALALLATSTSPPLPQAVAASAIYLASTALFWWAWRSTRQEVMQFAFSMQVPQRLHVTGPYALVRHPYYSSYVLSWTALAVAVPSVPTMASLAGMTGVYWMAASAEERRIMRSPCADAYDRYRADVGRFLPRLKPLYSILARENRIPSR